MARAGGGGSRNQSRSRSPHGWCTYLSTQGFPVELSSSSTSSSSNAPVADTGLGKFLGKLLGKFLGNLRCLHIMHTDAGPWVGFSELRDVLAQSMAAYASDGEDALNETEHCAPEELQADILEPPPEILVGDGAMGRLARQIPAKRVTMPRPRWKWRMKRLRTGPSQLQLTDCHQSVDAGCNNELQTLFIGCGILARLLTQKAGALLLVRAWKKHMMHV